MDRDELESLGVDIPTTSGVSGGGSTSNKRRRVNDDAGTVPSHRTTQERRFVDFEDDESDGESGGLGVTMDGMTETEGGMTSAAQFKIRHSKRAMVSFVVDCVIFSEIQQCRKILKTADTDPVIFMFEIDRESPTSNGYHKATIIYSEAQQTKGVKCRMGCQAWLSPEITGDRYRFFIPVSALSSIFAMSKHPVMEISVNEGDDSEIIFRNVTVDGTLSFSTRVRTVDAGAEDDEEGTGDMLEWLEQSCANSFDLETADYTMNIDATGAIADQLKTVSAENCSVSVYTSPCKNFWLHLFQTVVESDGGSLSSVSTSMVVISPMKEDDAKVGTTRALDFSDTSTRQDLIEETLANESCKRISRTMESSTLIGMLTAHTSVTLRLWDEKEHKNPDTGEVNTVLPPVIAEGIGVTGDETVRAYSFQYAQPKNTEVGGM